MLARSGLWKLQSGNIPTIQSFLFCMQIAEIPTTNKLPLPSSTLCMFVCVCVCACVCGCSFQSLGLQNSQSSKTSCQSKSQRSFFPHEGLFPSPQNQIPAAGLYWEHFLAKTLTIPAANAFCEKKKKNKEQEEERRKAGRQTSSARYLTHRWNCVDPRTDDTSGLVEFWEWRSWAQRRGGARYPMLLLAALSHPAPSALCVCVCLSCVLRALSRTSKPRSRTSYYTRS